MRIYASYIISSLASNYLLNTGILAAIFWFIQVPRLINTILANGADLKLFFDISLLTIPYIILNISPLSILFSIVHIYQRLISDREVLSLQNSGLTYLQIARPAIIFSSIICIFSVFLSFWAVPKLNRNFYEKLLHYKENYAHLLLEAGIFNHPTKNLTIYFEIIGEENKLKNIFVSEKKLQETTVITAKEGILIKNNDNNILNLKNGVYHKLDKNKHLQILNFDETIININLPAKKSLNRRLIDQLYIFQLNSPDKNLPELVKRQYKIELHRRITWPLYNLTSCFIAISYLLRKVYSRNTDKKIYYVLLFAVTVIITNFSLYHLSLKNINYIASVYFNIFIIIFVSFLKLKWDNFPKMNFGIFK